MIATEKAEINEVNQVLLKVEMEIEFCMSAADIIAQKRLLEALASCRRARARLSNLTTLKA